MTMGLSPVGLDAPGLPANTGGTTTVNCALGALTVAGMAAVVGGAVDINCTLGAISEAGLKARIGTITVTLPTSFQYIQRNGSNQANIAITGSYTGSPAAIEASWNGGAYTTIVASPSGGTFSGTLSAQAMGQGTLNVRFTDQTGIIDTKTFVSIGDIYIVMGQSNHVGHATGYVTPSTSNFHAGEFNLNNTWGELLETSGNPFNDVTGGIYSVETSGGSGQGSYFGALASKIMATGVPVAFVPCALGSTAVSAWQPNSGNHSLTSTLYGAALTRATLVGDHKAMLWYQGEQDTNLGTSQATYEASLNTVINTWFSDTGRKTVVYVINSAGASTPANVPAIQYGLIHVGAANANAIPGPNMDGVWPTNIHYTTSSDVNAVANAAWNVLNAQFYGGTVISASTAGTLTMAMPISNTDVSCSLGAFSLAGQSASVGIAANINCSFSTLTESGLTAGVSSDVTVSCNRGADSIAGLTALIGSQINVNCLLGAVVINGPSANVGTDANVNCIRGGNALGGYIATIGGNTAVNCSLGAVSEIGFLSTTNSGLSINCSLGTSSMDGFYYGYRFVNGNPERRVFRIAK